MWMTQIIHYQVLALFSLPSEDESEHVRKLYRLAVCCDERCGYMLAALLIAALFTISIEVVPSLGCLFAAQKLHNEFLQILHKPLSFFDTTPIGRILSTFSRDIDILDNCLRAQIIDTIWCSVEVC